MRAFASLLLIISSQVFAQEAKKEISWTEIIELAISSKETVVIDGYNIINKSEKFRYSSTEEHDSIQINVGIEIYNSTFSDAVRTENIDFYNLSISESSIGMLLFEDCSFESLFLRQLDGFEIKFANSDFKLIHQGGCYVYTNYTKCRFNNGLSINDSYKTIVLEENMFIGSSEYPPKSQFIYEQTENINNDLVSCQLIIVG